MVVLEHYKQHMANREKEVRKAWGIEINVKTIASTADCPDCEYDTVYRASKNPNCQTCFTRNTFVCKGEGFVEIPNISVGEIVETDVGKKVILNKFNRKYTGNMVHIRTNGNTIGIDCTENHRFYVLDCKRFRKKYKSQNNRYDYNAIKTSGKIELKKANNLTRDDFLLFPINENKTVTKMETSCKLKDRYWTQKELALLRDNYKNKEKVGILNLIKRPWEAIVHMANRNGLYRRVEKGKAVHNYCKKFNKKIPKTLNITKDLVKFFAWYIAEGCYSDRTITFSLNYPKEINVANDLVRIGKEIFGLDGIIKIKPNNHTVIVNFNSIVLARFMANKCGHLAENKKIPMELMECEYKHTLLDSLVAGDGHIGGNETTFTTVSRKLAYQVWELSVKLGFNPYIYNHNGAYRNNCNHLDSYTVGWTRNRTRKNGIGKFYFNKFFCMKIKEKTNKQVKDIDVYNINVKDRHNYVANTYLVENCGGKGKIITYTNHNEQVLPIWITEENIKDVEPGIINVGDVKLKARYESKDYFDNAIQNKTVLSIDGKDMLPIRMEPVIVGTSIYVYCTRTER